MNILLSKSEEDYLKALFDIIIENQQKQAGTNQLASYLNVSPSSVNNMLKKLREKQLVDYEKYGKLRLTRKGKNVAVQLIRKHRLWETFLYKQLNFSWDEVHEVAEQLEHIKSQKLITEIDRFLGYPVKDPHGAIIPDKEGKFKIDKNITLADMKEGEKCKLVSVQDNSAAFLRYVTEIGLALSSEIEILEFRSFDRSLLIGYDGQTCNVSRHFAQNVYVEKSHAEDDSS